MPPLSKKKQAAMERAAAARAGRKRKAGGGSGAAGPPLMSIEHDEAWYDRPDRDGREEICSDEEDQGVWWGEMGEAEGAAEVLARQTRFKKYTSRYEAGRKADCTCTRPPMFSHPNKGK